MLDLLEIELALRIFAAPMDTAQAEGSRHD